MCEFFDKNVPQQCREDDAEEVTEKERANFCEWFKPHENAFDAVRASADRNSRSELSKLFGEGDDNSPEKDPTHRAAEDLFK